MNRFLIMTDFFCSHLIGSCKICIYLTWIKTNRFKKKSLLTSVKLVLILQDDFITAVWLQHRSLFLAIFAHFCDWKLQNLNFEFESHRRIILSMVTNSHESHVNSTLCLVTLHSFFTFWSYKMHVKLLVALKNYAMDNWNCNNKNKGHFLFKILNHNCRLLPCRFWINFIKFWPLKWFFTTYHWKIFEFLLLGHRFGWNMATAVTARF